MGVTKTVIKQLGTCIKIRTLVNMLNYIPPLGWAYSNTCLPGAQYICSMALEQISDWTSLHCPKKVRHTFPVKTLRLVKIRSMYVLHMHSLTVRMNSPLLVSRTFLGLRSRHRMPCWCRLSRASRTWAPQTWTSASESPQQVCMALSADLEVSTGTLGVWHHPSTSMISSSPCPPDPSDLTDTSSPFLWGGASAGPVENQLTNDRFFAGATFSPWLSTSQASSTPSFEHVSPRNVPCFSAMLWQRVAEEWQELSEVSVCSENTALSVLLMTNMPSAVGLLCSCFKSETVSAELPLKTDPWLEPLVSHDALPRIWVWQWRGRCKMAGEEVRLLFLHEVWFVRGDVCPGVLFKRQSVTA